MTRITTSHRNFYVDGKLEFSLFYDDSLKDKDLIIKNFLEGSDWKHYCQVHEKKYHSCMFSPDLLTVEIKTK